MRLERKFSEVIFRMVIVTMRQSKNTPHLEDGIVELRDSFLAANMKQ